MNDLEAIARRWGIEPGYHDVFGHWHAAGPATLDALVRALSHGRERPHAVPEAPAAAPIRAWQGDGKRHWLVAVQLYGLKSARNWGIGDFTDLKALIGICAAHGAAGIGLNPLHALFPDRPEHASPYAPNSRLFLNPLYIDVEPIPECPGAPTGVAALRAGDLVDYPGVAKAKLAALRAVYDRFRGAGARARRADFEAFRAERGEALTRFACFEVLRRRHDRPWPEWPPPWRRPARGDLERFRRDNLAACEFEEFLQWIADRQLADCKAAAKAHGMKVGLYIDVAVGIDPHGADAWAQQDAVLSAVSVGAPPDEFNPAGQDWGLAPFNPDAVAADNFAPMRQLLAAAMRHAGAIRLDHVLGLKRVFMIPHGMGATDGAYVRFPFEPLLQAVAEESVRFRCSVIGEDLGTVPEAFRDTMAKWGLWTYRVMLFERAGDDAHFKPPEAYPAEALATFNTHDLPSFRGWLTGHDLRAKRGLGLDPGEGDEARAWAQEKLREMLSARGQGYAPDDLAAAASFLGATPSRLVAIALDDIAGAAEQINIPGTTSEHPNWRRRVPVTLEELGRHEDLRRVGEAFAKTGRRS
ncbi:MAG TPA: 4-alpha-glucanotransferase [Pseudolabrys sp.]|nr:4-alpha-glucanotransferase [Pseudolabrys sp.]